MQLWWQNHLLRTSKGISLQSEWKKCQLDNKVWFCHPKSQRPWQLAKRMIYIYIYTCNSPSNIWTYPKHWSKWIVSSNYKIMYIYIYIITYIWIYDTVLCSCIVFHCPIYFRNFLRKITCTFLGSQTSTSATETAMGNEWKETADVWMLSSSLIWHPDIVWTFAWFCWKI